MYQVMERRVAKVVRAHEQEFKCAIRDWMMRIDPEYSHGEELVQFVFDYPNVQLTADHFQRRKRVKNSVPVADRCLAKRASGERCTRRKRPGGDLCGTHVKGTPHGVVDKSDDEPGLVTVELWLHEVQGINYHVDASANVYSPEDIVMGVATPRVIGKLCHGDDGTHSISFT